MKKLGIGITLGGVVTIIWIVMNGHASQPSIQYCDPSYPDFCISSYSADLDCNQIPYHNFLVLQPDRHGFDQDHDRIGCER
ncbi:MAG: hypothetical protein EB163_06535 [Nitrososphaeria archaeon]|nr:hypothetical protein [Nitrososphaeria archaeon]NDB46930.1 hypothetical protein [Nitrososphaeria archaeon]NDB63562.1 hypothetical protein [Nitrosopumilaceae archaeon]